MSEHVRSPIVAGTFYPARTDQLREDIRKYLGETLTVDANAQSQGLISPHAGYAYSGHVAGQGFREAARAGRPDVVVILGASHSALEPWLALSPHATWETPLGRSPVEQEIVDQLHDAGFRKSFQPFAHEHSMEVQLPFVQYIWGSETPIVPICVAPRDVGSIQEAARGLAKALQGHKALIIASSDFSHYLPAHLARTLDAQALDRIAALDTVGFDELCRERDLTICGVGVVELLMQTALELDMRSVRLINYATSGDVTGDLSSVVGYASVILKRDESTSNV